jgi:hypothetical protein
MHTVATDLAIRLLEDRPGTLARAFDGLAKAGLNVEGFAEIDGVLHLVTVNPAAARRAVEAAGFTVASEDLVLLVSVPDRPGVAASVFQYIASAGGNVKLAYVAMHNRLVIGTTLDLQKLGTVLSWI